MADDDPEDRFIMEMLYEELGLSDKIHIVKDGQYVIDYLHEQNDEDLPALIVLDLNMPRLSGVETLKAIKDNERFRHIDVIIYSTSLNEIQMKQCLEYGAKAYIIKPATYEEGLDILRKFYAFSKGEYTFSSIGVVKG